MFLKKTIEELPHSPSLYHIMRRWKIHCLKFSKSRSFVCKKNRTKNSLVDKKTCNYMHCLIDTGSRNQRNVSKWRHIIWRHYSFLCLLGLITFFHFISGLRPQRDFWSPENFLSNGIWYIYIWKKNIFDFFSGCRIMTSFMTSLGCPEKRTSGHLKNCHPGRFCSP